MAYGRLASVLAGTARSPEAYLRTLTDAAAHRASSASSTSSSAEAWPPGPSGGPAAPTCCGSGTPATPTGSTTCIARGPAHRRPARRRPGRADDGPAQDHQRRLAQHPHRRGASTRTRRRRPGFAGASPTRRPDELRALLARARPSTGSRPPSTPSATAACHEALAAFAETGARGGIEHAQLTTRDDVTPHGAPRRARQRAARPPARRPRRHRAALARTAPSAASRCGGCSTTASTPGPRLGRPGLAARPVAGHRRRRPPLRRRPRAWHPEQSITPREALAASTDGQGTVTRAGPADLVLLDADPLDGSDSRHAEQAAGLRSMPRRRDLGRRRAASHGLSGAHRSAGQERG